MRLPPETGAESATVLGAAMGGAALGMEIGSTYGGKAGAAMGGAAGLAAVRAEPADAAVHEWRKRSKDLWYHLRLLRDGRREVLAPAADRAHELSDLLGDHHDLAVLAEDVKARRNGLSTASRRSLLTGIRRRQRELLAKALPLGEELYAEKPKEFSSRLRAYWSAAAG